MNGIQKGIDWLRLQIRRIPVEYRESFLRDSGADNLTRLRLFCIVLAAFSVYMIARPATFGTGIGILPVTPLLLNVLFSGAVVLVLGFAEIIHSRIGNRQIWLVRLPVIILAVSFLWWGCYTGSMSPFGLNLTVFFLICLFIVYSIFILTITEAFVIMMNGLLAYFWVGFSGINAEGLVGLLTALSIFLGLAFVVSRVVFYGRLSSFLNWENISSMNSSLKWEIKNHQQTLHELEAIRNDLDRQVGEKTSYLRETNQRLQEEIAERRYADKVKTVLYRISGIVNQNNSIQEAVGSIREQLKQILDVTNFMVGTYDSDKLEIEPVYQENATESFERYRLGRTLSSYVIRHKKSLLVNKKGIKELAGAGEIEIVGVMANCWLGVPLMVEDRVVGILMVQSYKPTVNYDQSDLQLLEYVSEHLALAIERHEVQSKLIQAKEQAEESDRLKSAFLSNLSHEIRTPLNSILGFTEVMADPDFTDAQRQQYTSQVIESGHRLLNTLTKMVELAKLQAHQMQFEIQDVEVGQIFTMLKEDIELMLCTSKKTGLEMRIDLDSRCENQTFMADPIRMKQLVMCLVENAVKFTDKGYLEIGCRKYDQKQLLFWVKDSGIGMNQDELEHVFEWFIKGQKATDNFYQGTGLGLTITKLMVELMNGQIWAESEPGQGSCFYFTLPAVLSESIQMVPDTKVDQQSTETGQSLSAV